ncbi:MAG TPA: histidine kinase [Longimicrobiaceae bacterium]|nr:histidine kinase [Longimicrobiaceae bacterium]
MTDPLPIHEHAPGASAGTRSSPGTVRALLRGPLPWAAFLGLFLLAFPFDWMTYSLGLREMGMPNWLTWGLLMGAVDAATWGVMGPTVLAAAWMLPLDRRRWRGGVAAILGVSLLVATLRLVAVVEVFYRAEWTPARLTRFELASAIPFQVLIVSALVGAGYGIRGALRERESTLALSRREAQLAEARFRSAKGRLQPRFLFATLDAISGLMDHDVREADRLLVRLSEVLRATFGGIATEEVALGEEMGFARLYLGVERACRGPGSVGLRTALDPPAHLALVPHMSVFPLIQQAWSEAVGCTAGAPEVEVAAHRAGESLRVEIRDPGPASAAERRARPAWQDVQLVTAMLERRFGEGHGWTLADLPAGGVAATLHLPLRLAGGAA